MPRTTENHTAKDRRSLPVQVNGQGGERDWESSTFGQQDIMPGVGHMKSSSRLATAISISGAVIAIIMKFRFGAALLSTTANGCHCARVFALDAVASTPIFTVSATADRDKSNKRLCSPNGQHPYPNQRASSVQSLHDQLAADLWGKK